MAIQLVKENPEMYEMFKVYEKCFFDCGNATEYWHAGANQPVCKECAKSRKTSELKKCSPKYKPMSKNEYKKAIGL